jgi:hypothetical protein
MTTELPETIELVDTIPERVTPQATIAGHNGFDAEGNRVVQLSIADGAGDSFLTLREGERFEFAGASWNVTKVDEPTTDEHRSVATLTREAS